MNRQQWNGRPKKEQGGGLNTRTVFLLAVCGGLILAGIISLIVTSLQQRKTEKTDEEMRALYHTETAIPTLTPSPSAEPEETASALHAGEPAQAAETGIPEETATPSPTLVPRLQEIPYPGNPGRKAIDRFQELRKSNQDIVGWLTIGSMVDEAVVQRDNEFYMDHDVKGRENASGALFLDAMVSLDHRPYSLIIFGHNMKTGSRFGSLRNYDSIAFYRNYPFIRFDTLYEEGQYVVFSVGTVSLEESAPNCLDFFGLVSLRTDERQQALDVLKAVSIHNCPIDVRLDDQLLVLVTCVKNDEERRVVAARRIRDGETMEELKALAEKSTDR